MRAAVIAEGALHTEERPDPVPGEGELLIRVRGAGVNGADLSQRAGRYPPPPGAPVDIPGLECAGETEDGERVMALLPGGGQAELVAVHASHTLPVPEHVTWPEAGGFVEVYATAHDALFTQAELKPGERLLVNGAAGGVGVAAVQLGVALGAQVTGTARHHQEELEELGADTELERPLRRDPRARRRRQPRHEPGAARTAGAHRRDRHGRRVGGDAELRPADGQARPHPRLDAALPHASRRRPT